uniref:Uncharacterized protein n=1 Tax=Mola mola TaxID=94237 RepID=A0A3Q3W9B7_MOLML
MATQRETNLGVTTEVYGLLIELYFICVRSVVGFIMLTYIFMLAWLGVTAFTSLPVFIYFNIWNICQNATVLEGATLCWDPRQYGIVPISEAKTICAGSEKFYKMCESNELNMTFHLFICALAGAGAAVIAMVRHQTIKKKNKERDKRACGTVAWLF